MGRSIIKEKENSQEMGLAKVMIKTVLRVHLVL